MTPNEVNQVLKERAALHLEDDFAIEQKRNRLIELLSENESETISYLDNCGKDEALWISEVFEEVAYNLQSPLYIECLKRLEQKFPDLKLADSVKVAEEYMN